MQKRDANNRIIANQLSEGPEKRAAVINAHLQGFRGQAIQYLKGETVFPNGKLGYQQNLQYSFNTDYMRQVRNILQQIDQPLLEAFENEYTQLLLLEDDLIAQIHSS